MITIGKRSTGSFDQPLALLSDCHRRIESFLDTLIRITENLQGGALDEEAGRALEAALRYFREAAPRHTQDEEESLFPRLRAHPDEEVRAALSTLDALHEDHRRAEFRHGRIDTLGLRWAGADHLDAAEVNELGRLLREMRTLYTRHIEIEDQQLFPLAGRVLGPTDLQAMGREMATRRGVDPDRRPGR